MGDRIIAEVGCDSVFTKQQVEQRYSGLFQDTLTKQLEKVVDVTFIVKQTTAHSRQSIEKPAPLFDIPKINQEEVDNAIKKQTLELFYF